MALEILAISRVAIGGIENGEKIRKEIDQHQRPRRGKPARSHSPNKTRDYSPRTVR